MNKLIISAISSVFLVISAASAEEKYSHFPSLDAPNTTVALDNLAKFNQKLQAIASKKDLTPEDMVKVHELTYTLENAVLRLQKGLNNIAVDLEKVHKASERFDQQTLRDSSEKYLTATQLILADKSCK